MGNVFSYCRISTAEEQEKQKYTRQENALRRYAEENDIVYVAEYKEDRSGKNFEDRKEWLKLEKVVQKGDTIVMKDLSRFTRETEEGYNKIVELMDRGVELVFIDNPTVCTAYIRKLINVAKEQNIVARTALLGTVKLLLVVELDRVTQERLIIIKRIRDGIEASSKSSGRRKGTNDKVSSMLIKDIEKYLENKNEKAITIMKKHDISRNTFKKYVKLYQDDKLIVSEKYAKDDK